MQRPSLLVAAVALAAVLAAATSAAATDGAIDLRITYRANDKAPTQVLTLRCDPALGTVPNPARACRRLRSIGANAFARTPRGRICTQIAGPPTTALVTGRYDGHAVWRRLSQRDGCEIAHWKLVAFLFPTS